jgi:hypothetical protein
MERNCIRGTTMGRHQRYGYLCDKTNHTFTGDSRKLKQEMKVRSETIRLKMIRYVKNMKKKKSSDSGIHQLQSSDDFGRIEYNYKAAYLYTFHTPIHDFVFVLLIIASTVLIPLKIDGNIDLSWESAFAPLLAAFSLLMLRFYYAQAVLTIIDALQMLFTTITIKLALGDCTSL